MLFRKSSLRTSGHVQEPSHADTFQLRGRGQSW